VAKVDQLYNRDCLIVADLSNDPTYGEVLFEVFGRRVIGVQIGRSGDGTTCQARRVKNGAIPVYNVGRTFLLELLLAEFRDQHIRLPDPDGQRAFEQLNALEPEQRENGIVYKCPPGQHDDLAMSLDHAAWAGQHLHLNHWQQPILDAHPASAAGAKIRLVIDRLMPLKLSRVGTAFALVVMEATWPLRRRHIVSACACG
jgi:hypothetical protein